jgi:hypothetical protein
VFTVNAVGSYVVGSFVIVSSLADPIDVFVLGQISNITGLDITVLVSEFAGIESADWVFALSGPTGIQGEPGTDGIPETLIDAKGDLVAGTANDTAARLAVGTDGFVLTADSAETTGLKWAVAAAGGGAGLQDVFFLMGA